MGHVAQVLINIIIEACFSMQCRCTAPPRVSQGIRIADFELLLFHNDDGGVVDDGNDVVVVAIAVTVAFLAGREVCLVE